MVVVVDNNKSILDSLERILFKLDIEYKTFLDFTPEFLELINTDATNIYIFEIHLPSASGLDIAKKIREKDWNSIIILMSLDMQPIHIMAQAGLMIYTFVYKAYNFVFSLEAYLNQAIDILYKKEEILYAKKIKGSKKCLVKTNLREYEKIITLKALKEKYDLKQVRRDKLEKL